MTAFAHFLWIAFHWGLAIIAVVVPAATLVPFAIIYLFRAPAFRLLRVGLIGALVTGFLMIIVMMTVGSTLVTSLVFHFGVPGEAVITDEEQTSEMYNNQYVSRMSVLIKTATGRMIETSFKDSDFNVYPSTNITRYPRQGQHFTVHYLQDHPDEFVIVANDDSEWARSLMCGDLRKTVAAARSRSQFARNDPDYQQRLASAQQAAEAHGCNLGSNKAKAEVTARVNAAIAKSGLGGSCVALLQEIAVTLQTATQDRHNQLLREKYIASVKAINDAGCTHQNVVNYPS